MKWTHESKYNVVSECKRFRISWATTPDGLVYSAWLIGKTPALVTTPDKEAAKRECKLQEARK